MKRRFILSRSLVWTGLGSRSLVWTGLGMSPMVRIGGFINGWDCWFVGFVACLLLILF